MIKAKNIKGLKTGVTTCSYSHKGELVFGGCEDLSLKMWDTRSFHRTSLEIWKAHPEELTCIRPLRDGHSVVSRSIKDGTKDDASEELGSLKLWDIRKPKQFVHSFTQGSLVNMFSQSNVALSASERIALVGSTCRKKSEEQAMLHAFDLRTG